MGGAFHAVPDHLVGVRAVLAAVRGVDGYGRVVRGVVPSVGGGRLALGIVLAGGRAVVGGLAIVMAVPGVVLRVPHVVFILVDGHLQVVEHVVVDVLVVEERAELLGDGALDVRHVVLHPIAHLELVGAGLDKHVGAVDGGVGRGVGQGESFLVDTAGRRILGGEGDLLAGARAGDLAAEGVEGVGVGDVVVGVHLDLGQVTVLQHGVGRVGLEIEDGSLVVECEAEATYSYHFCGQSRGAVARYAEVGGAVRLGLRLGSGDGYLVLGAVLAGIVNSVRALGLELAGYIELVGGRLGRRGVAALAPYVVVVLHVDVVASLPEEAAGGRVHRGAALGSTGHEGGQGFIFVVFGSFISALHVLLTRAGGQCNGDSVKGCERKQADF